MIMIIISILVGLVTALWLYFEQPIRKQKQYLSSIPGPDPLPILGNFMDIKGIGINLPLSITRHLLSHFFFRFVRILQKLRTKIWYNI